MKTLRTALCVLVAMVVVAGEAKENNKRLATTKLVCYYGNGEDAAVSWKCTHVVLPQEADVEAAREKLSGVKILLSVDRINEVRIGTCWV